MVAQDFLQWMVVVVGEGEFHYDMDGHVRELKAILDEHVQEQHELVEPAYKIKCLNVFLSDIQFRF